MIIIFIYFTIEETGTLAKPNCRPTRKTEKTSWVCFLLFPWWFLSRSEALLPIYKDADIDLVTDACWLSTLVLSPYTELFQSLVLATWFHNTQSNNWAWPLCACVEKACVGTLYENLPSHSECRELQLCGFLDSLIETVNKLVFWTRSCVVGCSRTVGWSRDIY